MEQTLVGLCIDDDYIKHNVKRYARILSNKLTHTFDQDDAEQEMWEAIIKALPRYTGIRTIQKFACDAAYSKLGDLIRVKKSWAYEVNDSIEDHSVAYTDRSYDVVDANIMLDEIEKTLAQESQKGRQYTLALSSIELRREGFTQSQSADLLGVTGGYMRKVMSVVRNTITENCTRVQKELSVA